MRRARRTASTLVFAENVAVVAQEVQERIEPSFVLDREVFLASQVGPEAVAKVLDGVCHDEPQWGPRAVKSSRLVQSPSASALRTCTSRAARSMGLRGRLRKPMSSSVRVS